MGSWGTGGQVGQGPKAQVPVDHGEITEGPRVQPEGPQSRCVMWRPLPQISVGPCGAWFARERRGGGGHRDPRESWGGLDHQLGGGNVLGMCFEGRTSKKDKECKRKTPILCSTLMVEGRRAPRHSGPAPSHEEAPGSGDKVCGPSVARSLTLTSLPVPAEVILTSFPLPVRLLLKTSKRNIGHHVWL